jgi:hypothetical protein
MPSESMVRIRRSRICRASRIGVQGVSLVLGRRIRDLAQGKHPTGTREVSLDASDLPSAICFYDLLATDS